MSGLVESSADARSKIIGQNFRCRAWVNFTGSGTSPGIRNSGNVSSITDNGGTGDYTVNFTTAMPDANYCCTVTGYYFSSGSSNGGNDISNTAPISTTSARIINYVSGGSKRDIAQVHFAAFR